MCAPLPCELSVVFTVSKVPGGVFLWLFHVGLFIAEGLSKMRGSDPEEQGDVRPSSPCLSQSSGAERMAFSLCALGQASDVLRLNVAWCLMWKLAGNTRRVPALWGAPLSGVARPAHMGRRS